MSREPSGASVCGCAAPAQKGGGGMGGIPLSSGKATGRLRGEEGHEETVDEATVDVAVVEVREAGREGG